MNMTNMSEKYFWKVWGFDVNLICLPRTDKDLRFELITCEVTGFLSVCLCIQGRISITAEPKWFSYTEIWEFDVNFICLPRSDKDLRFKLIMCKVTGFLSVYLSVYVEKDFDNS